MRSALLLGCLAAGCGGGNSGFQAAVPTRAAIAINVPGARASGSGAMSQALLGAQATFYTQTVQIATWLNGAASSMFQQIDVAVASPPSGQDATHEYWGPFTPALSPMTIELAVEKVDAQDYNFFLGGKPKGADNSAFTGLMGGGVHQADAQHASGHLEANFSESNTLDPTVNKATGVIAFVHDNTQDPRTVDVHFANFVDGSAGSMPLNADYHYAEHSDTLGSC